MQESIIIRNFGPIKEVEIKDIRPFTVFIGESGSGKSTIMKMLVLFRWIYKVLNVRSYLKYANITDLPFIFDFKSYLSTNGILDYLHSNSEIIYKKGSTTIRYNKRLATSPIIPENELSLEKMSFIADKRNLIPDILAANKFSSKIPYKKTVDFDDVISFYLRETYEDFIIASKDVSELKFDYLGVRYFSEQTSFGVKYFIEGINDTKHPVIKLEDASSGIQTVTPLSVIVEYFSKKYNFSQFGDKIIFRYLYESGNLKKFNTGLNIDEIKHKNIHFHIEEPELSLYPESQRSLINFIINRCFVEKREGYDMTVMFATHSPYIINHLNLLIKAFDTNTLIENQARLSYDDMAVYLVEDGEMLPLKILNERLINTNPLSDTINDIYDEYNQLLQ